MRATVFKCIHDDVRVTSASKHAPVFAVVHISDVIMRRRLQKNALHIDDVWRYILNLSLKEYLVALFT